MKLSTEAINSDRALQMSELVDFLNKEGLSDWAENTDQEIIEYETKEDGDSYEEAETIANVSAFEGTINIERRED